MKNTEGEIDIHNVRFYNLSPRSINCIRYNNLNGKIALTRADSTIEIWDITYAPTLEKTILHQESNYSNDNPYSIEGICWYGERLFSGDLSGEIIEYDLKNLTRKRQQFVTGNSIWCLDVNNQQNCLAAGTEEGYLNIFDLSDDNLLYRTVFDKQEGRILCCKYSRNGDYIVTGSLDVVRIWCTKTGNAIRQMSTGRSEKKKNTIVWTIQILQDFTIISGDSRGQIIVWDGNTGTQIESHQVFQKDILTSAVNEEENILMCAGVEPLIRIYCLTPITKNNQTFKRWVKFLQRHVHDHDVKAVAFAGLKIVSGGIDGFLGFSSYSKMHSQTKKFGPFLQNPCVSIAVNVRNILLRYPNFLQIWKLGPSDKKNAEKLLELKSKNGDFIICSAISSDGKWLVYSTSISIRLFSLGLENNLLKMSNFKVQSKEFSPAIKVFFSNSSDNLYLLKSDNKINIFNLSSNSVNFITQINVNKYIEDTPHVAMLSNDDKFLAIASTCKNINIWYKNEEKWKHYVSLPRYSAPITALEFHPHMPKLVAAFSDGKIFEYDLDEKKFINSKFLVDTDFTMDSIKNILIYDKGDEKILLQNESKILSCVWSDDDFEEEIKRSKNEKGNNSSLKVKLEKPYDNIIETRWLSETEIIIVGVNPVSLIEVLPDVYKRKIFGAS